jgi:uncharacterized protein (DUF305 family)
MLLSIVSRIGSQVTIMAISRLRWVGIAPLAASLALVACTSTHRTEMQTAPAPAATSVAARVRADSVRHPYIQADVDFMSHMIGHHAQALVMAGWAPSHGASPSVRTLAGRIINGQQDEIASMQRWLRDRAKPVPEAQPSGMKMTMGGHEHMMLMPGMLTQDQMKELDQARGPEFDRLFLTYMIQHHRGAVTMVTGLFATNGAAQDETVFKFANDVNVDQSTEIARMERMLGGLQSAKGAS